MTLAVSQNVKTENLNRVWVSGSLEKNASTLFREILFSMDSIFHKNNTQDPGVEKSFQQQECHKDEV